MEFKLTLPSYTVSQKEAAALLLLEVTVANLPQKSLPSCTCSNKSAGTVGSVVWSQAKLPLIYKCPLPIQEQLGEENYASENARTENILHCVNEGI